MPSSAVNQVCFVYCVMCILCINSALKIKNYHKCKYYFIEVPTTVGYTRRKTFISFYEQILNCHLISNSFPWMPFGKKLNL